MTKAAADSDNSSSWIKGEIIIQSDASSSLNEVHSKSADAEFPVDVSHFSHQAVAVCCVCM